MKVNGNITLNALGQSEVQNLVIERFSSTPSFFSSEAGRLIYNTTTRLYYMNTGLAWVALATGGDAAELQTEVDTLETALGSSILASGAFNANAFTGSNIVAATSVTDAINQLDASITGKNELSELLDVALTSPGAGEFLRYDSVAQKWVNHVLVLADVTDVTATATEVNYLSGVTSSVQTQITNEVTRATTAEGVNASAISAEVTRATAAEAAIAADVSTSSTALAAEVTRATGAESTLNDAIVQEASDRAAADLVVAAAASDQASTEATARQNSDEAINTRIDGVQAELDITQAGAGLDVTGTYTASTGTTYLGAATSLKNADVLLDAAIKAEADTRAAADSAFSSSLASEVQARIDGDTQLQTTLQAYIDGKIDDENTQDQVEMAARIAADAALQAELDNTQVGAGLTAAGAYTAETAYDADTAPLGAHYISTATSLANADKVLDTAIAGVATLLDSTIAANAAATTQITTDLTNEIATRISADQAQQAEINAIEAGAGLEGDGTYVSPTGSNYLNAASSLKDADYILDIALKAENTRAAAAETANASAIAAEVTRATTAEGVNATAIGAEVTRATAAEGVLTTAVSDEVTRATTAEAALEAKLSQGYFLYTGAAATSHTVTHGIGSQFCNVTVIDSDTNEQIIPQAVIFDSATQLTVTFNTALATKVVVMGLAV